MVAKCGAPQLSLTYASHANIVKFAKIQLWIGKISLIMAHTAKQGPLKKIDGIALNGHLIGLAKTLKRVKN